jgi:hypothetical protein
MTTTPTGLEPAPTPAAPERRGAPLPVAAGVAALWAAVVGFLPLLGLAVLGTIGQPVAPAAVLRLATSAWLLGHGVAVQTPADRITLAPLLVSVLVGWRLVRAGVHASRATGAHRSVSIWPSFGAGAVVAVLYAGIGALAAWGAGTGAARAPVARAALTFGLFAAVAAIGGAVRHCRAGRVLRRRLPAVLDQALRTGIGAAAFLLAAGAAAAGVALALAGGDAATVLGSFGAGVAGQAGMTALCLLYLPNVAIWGIAYLLGPGFAVGTGTVVSPGDVLLGPVPGLPVFAGLPSAPLTGIGPALLGVPLVAGLVAGWLLARRARGGWASLLGAAALAAAVAGGLIHLAVLASRGGLGSGRLATIGPVDWRIGLFAAGVTCVGTMVGAAAARTVTR